MVNKKEGLSGLIFGAGLILFSLLLRSAFLVRIVGEFDTSYGFNLAGAWVLLLFLAGWFLIFKNLFDSKVDNEKFPVLAGIAWGLLGVLFGNLVRGFVWVAFWLVLGGALALFLSFVLKKFSSNPVSFVWYWLIGSFAGVGVLSLFTNVSGASFLMYFLAIILLTEAFFWVDPSKKPKSSSLLKFTLFRKSVAFCKAVIVLGFINLVRLVFVNLPHLLPSHSSAVKLIRFPIYLGLRFSLLALILLIIYAFIRFSSLKFRS